RGSSTRSTPPRRSRARRPGTRRGTAPRTRRRDRPTRSEVSRSRVGAYANSMSSAALFRWAGGDLVPIDYCDPSEWVVEAADSWLTSDGSAFALSLHRDRFFAAATERGAGLEGFTDAALESFWGAALAAIPSEGDWFPRVELQSKDGAASFLYRERAAPASAPSVTLATYRGPDPRRVPRIKGPDLGAMMQVRRAAQERGADEGV